MRRYILAVLSAIIISVIWSVIILAGALEGWWHSSIAPHGDIHGFWKVAQHEVDSQSNGNAALVLIKNNKVYGEHYRSVGSPVDGNTLFQVASLSKWISSWGVLSLVDQGKLDLDQPISDYLTRWQLPQGEFDNDEVTVRRLLSHTAGLTDGLGYGGFLPEQEIQTLEQSLTKASDASPGKGGRVMVGLKPGSAFEYSGGGFTLLQLLIEEVSGLSFNEYMTRHVFKPLGMARSTYVLDTSKQENIAILYDEEGKPAIHYKFASLAATSLYTSTDDLTQFINAHFSNDNGPKGRGVIKPETVALMRLPHASQLGAEIWGLGTILFAPNNTGDFIVGHDGSNEPAINTTARFDPDTGDGIIILETGNKFLATKLAGEWVYWLTGNIDFLTLTFGMSSMITTILWGWFVAFLIAALAILRLYRSRKNDTTIMVNV